jgi:dienelactone hydrolase
MSNKCCPTDIQPAINDYKGVGRKVTLEGFFDMYVTGSGPHAIVIVYDIFGWTPNSEQLADALAQAGKCMVVMPDFMRGQPWPPSNVPVTKEGAFPEGVEPEDGVNVLYTWITTHPTCKFDREDEWTAVKTYLVETHQVTKVGAVGMCWGGKVAFVAAAGGLLDAVATCHGSFLEAADIQAIHVPICMLNSKDEPEQYQTDLKPLILVEPSPNNKNVFKNFPTMHHGWMGTRGTGADTDFGQQEIRDRFSEGVTDLVNFFTAAFE